MARLFYCTETEKIYSETELDNIRKHSIITGNSLATDSLENFIKYSLVENNGTLIEVKTVYSIYENGKAVLIVSNLKSDLE